MQELTSIYTLSSFPLVNSGIPPYFCICPFLWLILILERSIKTPAFVNRPSFWLSPLWCQRVSGPFYFYFFVPLAGSFPIQKKKGKLINLWVSVSLILAWPNLTWPDVTHRSLTPGEPWLARSARGPTLPWQTLTWTTWTPLGGRCRCRAIDGPTCTTPTCCHTTPRDQGTRWQKHRKTTSISLLH